MNQRADASAVSSLPVVGVMGSGAEEHADKAEPLGRWLATRSVHLLTGGGAGVMTAVARAFTSVTGRKGLSIGILPARGESRQAYPNPWVELPIRTHLPFSGERGEDALSRNHINILSSDVIVALPGSAGTASEVQLALRYGTPLIAFVDALTDIPDLPEDVPRTRDLAGVQAFLDAKL